jgi:hypothetical protein
MKKTTIWILLILAELILTSLLGYAVLWFFMRSDTILGESYFSGIVQYYGIISLVFFAPVLAVGSIGAKWLGKSHLLKRSIFLSIIFWIVSLVIYMITFNYFSYTLNWRILPISILQIAIVLGFNFGLISKSNKKINNR